MIDEDELIEHAIVYGDYKGIPKQQVREALASGMDVVMRIDVQGAETVRRMAPEALMIFITTENEDELVQRLETRKTETVDSLAIRIATARKELKRVEAFDYVIVNHDFHLDETVDTIRAIINAEHHRVKPRKVTLVNDYPPASDSPSLLPLHRLVRVSLPQSAPYVTYTIIGITVLLLCFAIGKPDPCSHWT